MDIMQLLSLEIGLIALIGGGLWRLMQRMDERFTRIDDKMDRGFDTLHGRISKMKDEGSEEHKKIAVRLATIETTIKIADKTTDNEAT